MGKASFIFYAGTKFKHRVTVLKQHIEGQKNYVPTWKENIDMQTYKC